MLTAVAAARVFALPELLEMILAETQDPVQLFVLQRTNIAFHDTISTCKSLRKRMSVDTNAGRTFKDTHRLLKQKRIEDATWPSASMPIDVNSPSFCETIWGRDGDVCSGINYSRNSRQQGRGETSRPGGQQDLGHLIGATRSRSSLQSKFWGTCYARRTDGCGTGHDGRLLCQG